MARIVLLNGVGSAGKSSIARALQEIAGEVYLHVPMDVFLEMLPAASFGREDGFIFETQQQDGKPVVVIRSGEAGRRAMQGMRHAVAAMAGQGNNLIVDDVMTGGELDDYRALLAGHEVFTVGVMAALDVLEAREAARADRMIGLARWQFGRVHAGRVYDFTVDTGVATAAECAAAIRARFGL